MILSSKELTIIFVEFLIGMFIAFLSYKTNLSIGNINFSSMVGLILLAVTVVLIVALVFGIIYKRIGEIDKALEKQEIKQKN